MLTVEWPPVRNCFIPDPGYAFWDVDLAGADAQIVAWEADEPEMKEVFRRGQKIHAANALKIYGPAIAGEDGKREPTYTRVKRACHATNYGAHFKTVASKCAMSIGEAEKFCHDWKFVIYPGIGEWHKRTEFNLQTTGTVSNKFGYEVNYFDRPDGLLPEALAWVPQSTVASVTDKAMIRLRSKERGYHLIRRGNRPALQLVMQVHDSLVIAVRIDAEKEVIPEMYEVLHNIVVPYDDPLIIPWGAKRSTKSWGECKSVEWSDYLDPTRGTTVH